VVLRLSDIDRGYFEIVLIILSLKLESWPLVVEALPVGQGVACLTGNTVFPVVLDTSRRVLEADVVMQKVSSVAFRTDSIRVLSTGVVSSLTLVVVVHEEPFFTSDALLPIAALGDAGVLSDFAFSAAHDHVPTRAELTVSVHVVLQTAWLVLDAVQSFPDVESLGALDTGAVLLSQAAWDLALTVHRLEWVLAVQAALAAGLQAAVYSALLGDWVHLEGKFAISTDSSLINASGLLRETDSVWADVVVVFALVASSLFAVGQTVFVLSDAISLENDEI
jgi:hypothetical protein